MKDDKKASTVGQLISNIFNSRAESLQERILTVFASTFIWGLLAHGFMLFNKISYHDDTAVFFGLSDMNGTVSQGRWMSGVFASCIRKIFGYDYSLPLYKGIFALFFIAVSLVIISQAFELKSSIGLFALGGVMVTSTTITCLFGYMYMALLYTFPFMLSVYAAFLICKYDKWYCCLLALILFVCAIGAYQLFFCSGLCVIFIYLVYETMDAKMTWKQWCLKCMKYVVFCVLALALYLIVTKLFVIRYGIALTNYAGLDTMGIVGMKEYVKRVLLAYAAYFYPNRYVTEGTPYPAASIYLYVIFAIILIVLFIDAVIMRFKEKDFAGTIQLGVLFALFPLVVNFIIVLAGYRYDMTCYCHIFIYAMLVFLFERFSFRRVEKNAFQAAVVLLLLMNIFFCRYDNACYLKAEMLMENAISYFNTLITRIQSVEGYTPEIPVVYIEPRKKNAVNEIPGQFRNIQTVPYNYTVINDYMWEKFMYIWCGYAAASLPEESYIGLEEVKEMPAYPCDGSIKMVDGAIVVKFAEPQY